MTVPRLLDISPVIPVVTLDDPDHAVPVARALAALARFRVLCETMRVSRVFVPATAAARDAENGPDFLRAAEAACGKARRA